MCFGHGDTLIQTGLEAVADAYHLLLLWSTLARLCIPPLLFVSMFELLHVIGLTGFALLVQYAVQSDAGRIVVCK